MRAAGFPATVGRELRTDQFSLVGEEKHGAIRGVRWMLAPLFRSVTVFVSHTRLPVPASRQTNARSESVCDLSANRAGLPSFKLLRLINTTRRLSITRMLDLPWPRSV